MSHDWIFDVLADLRRYALQNGMPRLASQVEAAQRIARDEVARNRRGCCGDDGNGNGGGGAPPTGLPD
jgi:hypothetical protein